jgi:hypothetical protein
MKKEPELHPSIPKTFYTILLVAGIALLVIWYVVYLIPQQRYFDPGLYAITAVLIAFGLVGRLLYSALEKQYEPPR